MFQSAVPVQMLLSVILQNFNKAECLDIPARLRDTFECVVYEVCEVCLSTFG